MKMNVRPIPLSGEKINTFFQKAETMSMSMSKVMTQLSKIIQ